MNAAGKHDSPRLLFSQSLRAFKQSTSSFFFEITPIVCQSIEGPRQKERGVAKRESCCSAVKTIEGPLQSTPACGIVTRRFLLPTHWHASEYSGTARRARLYERIRIRSHRTRTCFRPDRTARIRADSPLFSSQSHFQRCESSGKREAGEV